MISRIRAAAVRSNNNSQRRRLRSQRRRTLNHHLRLLVRVHRLRARRHPRQRRRRRCLRRLRLRRHPAQVLLLLRQLRPPQQRRQTRLSGPQTTCKSSVRPSMASWPWHKVSSSASDKCHDDVSSKIQDHPALAYSTPKIIPMIPSLPIQRHCYCHCLPITRSNAVTLSHPHLVVVLSLCLSSHSSSSISYSTLLGSVAHSSFSLLLSAFLLARSLIEWHRQAYRTCSYTRVFLSLMNERNQLVTFPSVNGPCCQSCLRAEPTRSLSALAPPRRG